jgi:drug/metabolite transporter (DMT)-like permease
MAVTICGVILISRSMDDGTATTPGPVDGAVVPPLPEAQAAAPTGSASTRAGASSSHSVTLQVVALSLLAAAGWGLGPVLVEMAENAYGAPSAFMMLESQLIGMLALGGYILWRRAPLFTRRLAGRARTRVLWLLLASGALEALYAVLFYLVIDQIGAVLAMLLSATAPVFGILAGMLLLKERLSARLVVAVALTLGGVFIATAARLFT